MRYALLVYSDQADWAELSPRRRPSASGIDASVAAMFEALGKTDPDSNGKELVDGPRQRSCVCVAGSASSRTGPLRIRRR